MEDKMIKTILIEIGVFSWALEKVGSEAELLKMFEDDFEGLMALCTA